MKRSTRRRGAREAEMLVKRDNTIHLKVSDDAHAALSLVADAAGKDKAALAAEMLEELLLGRAHAVRLVAARYASALNVTRVRS